MIKYLKHYPLIKKITQSVLICFILTWFLSASATSTILPEVLDLSRTDLSHSANNIVVLPRDGMTSYLFAEFPKASDSNIDKKKTINEYAIQLEKTHWKKFDMGSFVEFEKQIDNCHLLLQIVDTAFANRVLVSSRTLPEGIYFNLNVSESCDQDKFHEKITTQFGHVEVFTKERAAAVKLPAQPYGGVRQNSQITEYSANLSLKDLIDFDSHQTLEALTDCHTKSLFSAGYESKVGCFIEDRSKYPGYAKLDENTVYDSEPYISSRAGMFFRKQGFYVLESDSKEAHATVDYDKISYENDALPNLADVGFITQIKPEACNIMAWLFTAKDDSPLWQGIAFKTIKVKRKNGEIEAVKIYKKLNFLVSIAPLQGCK